MIAVDRLVLIVSLIASTAAFAADEEMSISDVRKIADEWIESIGTAVQCEIEIESIRSTDATPYESANYVIFFHADGEKCDDAREALTYRGESKGLLFVSLTKRVFGNDPPIWPEPYRDDTGIWQYRGLDED